MALEAPSPRRLIHFNNAGASLQSSATLKAVRHHLDLEEQHGGYEAVVRNADAMALPYTALAKLLNASPEEIAILTSATAAWQTVVYGLAAGWKPDDTLLTSVHEYASNFLAYLQLKKRTGVQIIVVRETADRDIDLEALEAAVIAAPRRPVLISVTHVSTNSGRIYDAAGVGAIAHRHGVPYLLDACQSVGQVPIDVEAVKCDFLTATGRKYLRGPRGVGFLYARTSAQALAEPGFIDLHGAKWVSDQEYELAPDAKRYESYEISFAAKAGLGVAVQEIVEEGIEKVSAKLVGLASRLREDLAQIPTITIQDIGRNLGGIVSFTTTRLNPSEIQQRLYAYNINVWVSPLSSTRLDLEARGVDMVVRASVHAYNTEEEVATFIAALKDILVA